MASQDRTRLNRGSGWLGVLGARLLGPFVLGGLVTAGVVAVMLYFSVNTQREQAVFAQREVAQRLAAQAGS